MEEYKERWERDQLLAGNTEPVCYRVFECSYNGSTRGVMGSGYGHGELHLVVSSSSEDENGRRAISGCGIREKEYTEIIDGQVDSNGNAEWTERIEREIVYHQRKGFALPISLSSHVGPASLRTEGRFVDGEEMKSFQGKLYGRDECRCGYCQAFWAHVSDLNSAWRHNIDGSGAIDYPQTLDGERVRWCPAEERRMIGEYILFRAKEEGTNETNTDSSGTEEAYHRMV